MAILYLMADQVSLDDVAGGQRPEEVDTIIRVAHDEVSRPAHLPAHGVLASSVDVNADPDRIGQDIPIMIRPDPVAFNRVGRRVECGDIDSNTKSRKDVSRARHRPADRVRRRIVDKHADGKSRGQIGFEEPRVPALLVPIRFPWTRLPVATLL